MIFREYIDKDYIKSLPILKFDGEIVIVNDKKGLMDCLSVLSKENAVGFDTEKKPTFRKGQYHPTALVQFSTLTVSYLIRINEIGLDDHHITLLSNPDVHKVGISIRDDIKALKKLSPFDDRGFVELNELARKIGIKHEGVRRLAAVFLERKISKKQQISNWENESLTDSQQIYAATDAWVCLRIYTLLDEWGYL